MTDRIHKSVFNTTLLVVGLGYLIDAFDLFLYNAVRVPSLRELGLDADAITSTGLQILNAQVFGMLLGSFLWGILGDKIGRKKALIGSILVYSLGSLGCAFVHHVELYGALRFLTGVGLAGELGLGAVLVAETVTDRQRDFGLLIYTLCAYLGIMAANLMAGYFDWRTCYIVGGVVGLALLLGRMVLFESGLFEQLADTKTPRGSLALLFRDRGLLKRWLCCVLFAVFYYFVVNILISFAPEFGKAVGVAEPIKVSVALLIYSACAMGGSVLVTVVSRLWQKRVRSIAVFLAANIVLGAYYLYQRQPSAAQFYALCGLMGFANFYVLLLYAAVEQFGTNMRATLGTSSLSVGRATLVITSSVFLALRHAGVDIVTAASYVGGGVFLISLIALLGLKETYNRNIDFIEKPHD
jgi:MFS family permease